MKLGTLLLANNLVLAPMLQVSTSPFRRFCRKFGEIGLVSVPMLYTKRLENSPNTVLMDLHKIEEERPISVQLIGSNVNALKSSIDFLESYKFDVLDINACCPSKRAIKAQEGGYLLKDLDKLKELLDVAVKHSSRPVSLKIRLGFNNSNDIDKLTNFINNSGIEFLTVHGRTVRDRFKDSTFNIDAIKKIKSLVKIPVVGNGNILNPKIAREFLEFTKVDALMIGRGSMGNPEIFNQIHQYLKKGLELIPKNNVKKMKELIKLFEHCVNEYLDGNLEIPCSTEKYKFMELKRNLIWLSKSIQGSTDLRIKISKIKTLKELEQIIDSLN
ncbi:MAG: tRNA-dihydrouridine synthase family protein [Candidatus Lokiarchaeota archaeon]|nr:tRNA-dihydrouridine synthase family protein [Candidatus Lokiarchaeota archaeon]